MPVRRPPGPNGPPTGGEASTPAAGEPSTGRAFARRAVALAVVLVAFNSLVNLLPQEVHDRLFVPLNVSLAIAFLWWARRSGVSWEDLGIERTRWRSGMLIGAGAGLLIGLPLFSGAMFPESLRGDAAFLARDSLDTGQLAYRALVRIPLGTALLEEVAFRGALYGLLLQAGGMRAAFAGSSVAFALWHVTPTVELLSTSERLSGALLWPAVLGGVVATGLGGVFFAALRAWSGGLAAPLLAHWFINGLGQTAGEVAF